MTTKNAIHPDQAMMRAILLARCGYPAPNPHVGCVIVREGVVVGEGWHEFAGGPHAEVVALNAAWELARGADAYVTLEPCDHQGRTGPCSLALIEAGIRSVTIATPDPNPKASGGAKRLEQAGVRVEWADQELRDQAAWVNRQFLQSLERKRPFVVAKAAITRDGFIARPDGSSKWITNEKSREIGHEIRAELGAVLVGRRTIEFDNPNLTARIDGPVNPVKRFVIDPSGKLSNDYKVFQGKNPAIRITGPKSVPEILTEIFDHGVTGLLVEGGAATVSSFLMADCLDQVELFQAATEFGEGIPWLTPDTREKFDREFNLSRYSYLDGDFWRTFRR